MTFARGVVVLLSACCSSVMSAQGPAPAKHPVTGWLSGGVGKYRAADPPSEYKPAATGAPLGHRSLWLCAGLACLAGRVSRGAAMWGGQMTRDERAFLFGPKVRSGGWQTSAGAGISWVRLENYFLYEPPYDPQRLERKERGVAIGGELTRAGPYFGVGLGLLGSMSHSSRYAALTVTLQLGVLR